MQCVTCGEPAFRGYICERCRSRPAFGLFAIALALGLVAVLVAIASARPPEKPVPVDQWSQDAAHVLARALVAEADYTNFPEEHAAIAWVLADRWRQRREREPAVTFDQVVVRYTSLWKRPHTPRKLEIRALPWGPSDAPHGRARWEALRAWLTDWAAGNVAHPCPRARHWGGRRVDSFPDDAVFVDCGRTRNRFYVVAETDVRKAAKR